MKFEANVGLLEGIIRMILAMVFALVAWGTGLFLFYVAGVLVLVTGMASYCPIKEILGAKPCEWKH